MPVRPEREKASDFLDRKAKIAGVGDESQAMHVGFGIIPITAIASCRCGYQIDFLIVPDHPLRDPARLRDRSYVHNASRLRRNAFITTLTDDSAIAAPAMIGDSNMPKNG